MKVAFDLSVNHFTRAGVAVYTNELLAALQATNPADEFIGLSFNPWFSRQAQYCRKLDTLRYHYVWQKWALNQALQRKRVDLYHETHQIAACRFRVPLIYTVNDLHTLKHPEHFPARWVAWVKRHLPATLRQARVIITISKWVAGELRELYPWLPHEKIKTIYDAVGRHFLEEPRVRMVDVLARHQLAQPYFLAVSTTAPNKNLERVLRAFHQVAAELPHQLVLAGAMGWGAQRWRELIAELQLSGRVRYLGFVPDAELPGLYRGADVFVYPSLYEGFGIPIVEAMTCGTPVLTGNVTSMPEVAGDAALLVDPYQVEAIAAGMQQLAVDPALRNVLREKGRVRASQFSWAQCARETYAIYKASL